MVGGGSIGAGGGFAIIALLVASVVSVSVALIVGVALLLLLSVGICRLLLLFFRSIFTHLSF